MSCTSWSMVCFQRKPGGNSPANITVAKIIRRVQTSIYSNLVAVRLQWAIERIHFSVALKHLLAGFLSLKEDLGNVAKRTLLNTTRASQGNWSVVILNSAVSALPSYCVVNNKVILHVNKYYVKFHLYLRLYSAIAGLHRILLFLLYYPLTSEPQGTDFVLF